MLKIERLPEVDERLFEIWRDGVKRFGEPQADLFQVRVESAVQRLAVFPQSGVSIDDVKTGYWILNRPYPIHIIYRFDDETLTIVKIFHGQENWEEKL